MARAKEGTRDGYPTSSRSEGRSPGSWSDPVGNLAVAGPAADPLRHAVAGMCAYADAAVALLRDADGQRARCLPPPPKPVVATFCSNCQTHGFQSVVHKAGRCVACYYYRRRHPELADAPKDTVRARHQGRRHVPPGPR